VLRALGLSEAEARECFRLALGRFTDEAQVDFAVEALASGIASVRGKTKGAA
jgi:cysteine sulfinate desulfinase/cysteine desulfurase-like protein